MILSAAVFAGLLAVTPAPGAAPCGLVDFAPAAAPRYVNGTAYERLRARVTFPDGHTESAVFPYPWVYPDGERTDPWSATNLRAGVSTPVALQMPPPGFDRSTLPPPLAYIVDHTDERGWTTLTSCPTTGAAASRADVTVKQKLSVDPSALVAVLPFTRMTSTPSGRLHIEECIAFTNRSAKTLRHVRFRLRLRNAAGDAVAADAIDVTGTFARGAGSPNPQDVRPPAMFPYCRPLIDVELRPSSIDPRIAAVDVSVEAVDYDDASSWRLSRP